MVGNTPRVFEDVAVAIVPGARSRDVRLERCRVAQLHGG